MPSRQVILRKKTEVAEGTMAFFFEKPEGFRFRAGQFAELTLSNPPETDAEGNVRTFSIASSPNEEYLTFATRMRDTAFKRVLKKMPLGAEVTLDGPMGSFTLHADSSRPAVFIAGGIGITPFRSIILQADTSQLPHHLLLIYSNRRPEDSAFLEELSGIEKENPRYKMIATMTEMEKSAREWNGRVARIDNPFLARAIEGLRDPICYVAGPPTLVSAVAKTLSVLGLGKDSIRTEEFEGY